MEEELTRLVARYMEIQESESHPENMLLFRGRLYPPEKTNLEKLIAESAGLGFYLHSREVEDGLVQIVFIPMPVSRKNRYWVNIILFVLTFACTLAVGAMNEGANIFSHPILLYKGLPFSLSLMFILLVHEMGHYVASRLHRVEATLPFFIPFPTIIGTMGAVIRIKSPIPTRKALLDIGAAGPIMGMIASVPLVFIGLKLSSFAPTGNMQGALQLGDSLLFSFISRLVLGGGQAGQDVILHPVAFAGWIGFFITSLNLLPVGQLDGGHIAYALFGRFQRFVAWGIWGLLLVAGFFWTGWWFWAILILVFGIKHPPPLAPNLPLDLKRKLVGWLCFALFILTVSLVPFSLVAVK